MKTFIFNVDGITCGGCVRKINSKFESDPAIKKITVSDDKRIVSISGEDTISGLALKSNLEELGFQVTGFEKAQ